MHDTGKWESQRWEPGHTLETRTAWQTGRHSTSMHASPSAQTWQSQVKQDPTSKPPAWYNAPMQRRSRFRRIAKRAGLVLCVLVLVAWGVSSVWAITWEGSIGTQHGGFSLIQGTVQLGLYSSDLMPNYHRLGLTVDRWTFTVPRDQFGLCLPVARRMPSGGVVLVPLWLTFALLAVPAALLWWRDRRPPRGHCQRCGYNLTGNLSGVCPECGQPI